MLLYLYADVNTSRVVACTPPPHPHTSAKIVLVHEVPDEIPRTEILCGAFCKKDSITFDDIHDIGLVNCLQTKR